MDKLDKLIAIEEIKRLKSIYIQSIDNKDFKRLETEVWAPDATFDVRAGGQKDVDSADTKKDKFTEEGKVVGREAVMALMRAFAPPGMVSVHLGYMPDIEILSETTARGVWGLEDTVTWPSGVPYNSLHGNGHWHDTYEKINGRWMIKTSRVTRLKIETT